jgi:hypothetical protein
MLTNAIHRHLLILYQHSVMLRLEALYTKYFGDKSRQCQATQNLYFQSQSEIKECAGLFPLESAEELFFIIFHFCSFQVS